jgi:hypothetical protein
MQPALTHKQRTALRSIPGARQVSAMEIEIFVASEHDPGVADREKTDAALDQVQALGIDWGGICSGYGAWSLRRDCAVDPVDFNNPSSRHHY